MPGHIDGLVHRRFAGIAASACDTLLPFLPELHGGKQGERKGEIEFKTGNDDRSHFAEWIVSFCTLLCSLKRAEANCEQQLFGLLPRG